MGKKNFKRRESKSLAERRKELKAASNRSSHQESEKSSEQKSPSIERLLDKAEQLIDEFNYELAQKFCQRALETDPDNIRALETSASLLLELGQTESAKHCLGRAVEVCPDTGFTKYMNLGQLMTGNSAVECYQKGIELMVKEKEAQQLHEVAAACAEERSVTDQDISSAYCAIAEVYLTDCCFDEAAEEKCKEFVEKAVAADQTNVEALQLKASFLLSINKKEEAKEAVKKSVSLWLPKLQASESGNIAEADFDPVESCPVSFSARMQCGKLLIEVEDYETAVDVLETLLDEDDEVPDIWYMLGWANYLQGQEYFCNARHYLKKGKEVFLKVKHEDPEMLKHIEELLVELGPEEDAENDRNLEEELQSSEEEDMDH